MNREMNQPPQEPSEDTPLEPWMLELAKSAVDELDAGVEVPREMMWQRIGNERRNRTASANDTAGANETASAINQHALTTDRRKLIVRALRWRQVAAIAAVLVGGVAIGRYLVPSPTGSVVAADTVAMGAGDGPSIGSPNDPSRVAMQEHLAKTVAVLATLSSEQTGAQTGVPSTSAIEPRARDLLTTTRLLLDQPQLRDSTTRRLLQDLELVLVQVIQARGGAPETQRAPRETLQETNLLTRVRAAVTASSRYDAPVYGGN